MRTSRIPLTTDYAMNLYDAKTAATNAKHAVASGTAGLET